MAKQSALPQVISMSARMRRLLFVAPLVVFEIGLFSHAWGPTYAAGLVAWFGVALLSNLIAFGVAAALGAQVVWLSFGIGPKLDRRVVGRRVRTIRALPIIFSWVYLIRGQKSGRNFRIVNGTGLLLPVVLAAVAAAVLPTPAAAAVGLMALVVFILVATARDPFSGRMMAARVFQRPTMHTDPSMAGSGQDLATQVYLDVQFGAFDEARAWLDQYRAIPGTGWHAANLETQLLAARGEYDAALRIRYPEPDPADSATLTAARNAMHSARSAKLLLLLVEQNPALAPQAAPLALRHLKAVAGAATGASTDRTGRVLLALHTNNLQAAKRENRICSARARTPLDLAEALCSQAVIEARSGKQARAARTLATAERFAPWYPRIAVVRRIVSSGAAAMLAAVPASDPARDTSHVFAEPWSVPQDGR